MKNYNLWRKSLAIMAILTALLCCGKKAKAEADFLMSSSPLEKRVKLELATPDISFDGDARISRILKELQLKLNKGIDGGFSINVGGYGKILGKNRKFGLAKAGIEYILEREKFQNETEAEVGFLSNSGDVFEQNQLVVGLNNRLSIPLFNSAKTNFTGKLNGGIIFSRLDKWDVDSWSLGGGLEHRMRISPKLTWHNEINHSHLNANPEKYFFLKEAEETTAMSALEYRINRTKITAIGALKRSLDDERILSKRLGLHIDTLRRLIMKAYFEKSNNNVKEYLFSAGVKIGKEKDKLLEFFYDREEIFGIGNNTFGIRFSFPLGKNAIDDFESYKEGNGLYARRGYLDRGLPFEENTEQLNTIRKLGEFSHNLEQITGTTPPRSPAEVDLVGGDCDEQANWFSYNAAHHGYKSYVLGYNLVGQKIGHMVSLVENKDGRLFVFEYGLPILINVNPNASWEQKVRAALDQSFKYLVLVPGANELVEYSLYNPSKGNYLAGGLVFIGNMRAAPTDPHIESGVKALIGDFF